MLHLKLISRDFLGVFVKTKKKGVLFHGVLFGRQPFVLYVCECSDDVLGLLCVVLLGRPCKIHCL